MIKSDYLSYACIPDKLDISSGDIVLLSSDISRIAYDALENGEVFDAGVFLKGITDRLGENGTLLLPVYNWGFCSGKVFDYKRTGGKTGFLGNAALKISGFVRTRHPIYSFAVWGKDRDYLFNIDTRACFGDGTVFDYLYKNHAKNIAINVPFNDHYTFCHHVEQILQVPYRYNKYFKSRYIDENGVEETRKYMMNVKKMELNVGNDAEMLYKEFIKQGAAYERSIGDITVSYIDIHKSYEIIRWDIEENNAGLQSQYKGQYDKKKTAGEEAYDICYDLFYVPRSLSGEGNRKTLAYLKENHLGELDIKEYPSGAEVFDWIVPPEWNIREAYIENSRGERIADIKEGGLLNILLYSESVDREMPFRELDGHIYSIENKPDAVPYVTSYYKRRWGFCITHRLREELRRFPDEVYKVKIDSDFNDKGVINYGELIINGYSDEEILMSSYICHPNMANDNLSGIAAATEAAKYIYSLPERRYTYRIIFIPETIGSLIYMKENLDTMKKNLKAGFVLSCIGDDGYYSCIHTPSGDTYTDKIVSHVLKHITDNPKEYDFLERGSDERQFCSPGAALPVVCLSRTKYGCFGEYHTSFDNLDFISQAGLGGGIRLITNCIDILENDRKYIVNTIGEPKLDKYGLYPDLSRSGSTDNIRNIVDTIAYLNGNNSVFDVANILNRDFFEILPIIKELESKGLITAVENVNP